MNIWARIFAGAPMRGALMPWLTILCLVIAGCGGERTPEATPTNPPAAQGEAGAANSVPANAAPTPTAEPAPTPATGTITLWHSWAQREGDALAQILDAFRASHPGVTVQTLFVAPDDLLQSYTEAVQAGSGPDLMIAPNWWLDDLVTLGVVQSLDGLLDASQTDGYWPATLDNLRWQDKLYGLPISYDTVALYYNPDLLPALPQTTDELLSRAATQPPQGIGLYNNLFHLAWGIPAFGGQIVDDTGKVVLDQNDGTAQYLTWLRQLANTPGSYVDGDYGMLMDRFKKGEYPFFVDGPWALQELRSTMPAVGVATLPAGPAGPARPWLYTQGVFFNPAAPPQQQELARLLGSHLTGADSGTVLAHTAVLLPANRNADLGNDAGLRAFARQAETAQAMPHGAVMDQIWRYGGDMLLRATAGVENPAAIVTDTTTLINEATGR